MVTGFDVMSGDVCNELVWVSTLLVMVLIVKINFGLIVILINVVR